MVALDHDRTRARLTAVEGATGDALNDDVVEDPTAIERDRQTISDDGRLEGLPLTRGRLALVKGLTRL